MRQNESILWSKASHGGIWKRIVDSIGDTHARTNLDKHVIKRQIGNGHGTKFWLDVWCGDETLAKKYPRLFALETEKHCVVSNKRDDKGWVWSWNLPIRNSRVINNFHDMVNSLPPNLNDTEDKWLWQFNGHNEFCVAKLRKFFDHI
ncbi:RNA-directed DNA polymerase, eukaryota, Reverse transcriptase zinc-binding domain protein [Artemisia annua]|uniref:RNA-directed DNA polymerase, eukaryota, Reverse transcriptase zinc-binding domain protein n=1 Tax=Artemisia annua TaxID=35608 RepID=A0A2U1KYW9_ARTAN|nr:RNA-directed DNA polymerase, eukaryota, Reverse transcriptase zinc-binding domain protein [Artemisia annua]